MKRLLLAVVFSAFGSAIEAGVLYQQPPDPSGGFYHSSWWDPDGSNYDEYVWDKFTLSQDADIDSITWRGAYDPAFGGATPVVNFTVGIYGSIVGGSQPDLAHPPLVEYQTGDNAGEAFAGTIGGVNMYDYRCAMPAAFHAQAGVPYWVQIEGWQQNFPGWSIARGTAGDAYHFRCQHVTDKSSAGPPTGCWFTAPSGDCAFTLLTAAATGIDAPATPAVEFGLVGTLPNPTRSGKVEVFFSLPNAEPAKLVLFDVAGRQRAAKEVGALGGGSHRVDLVDGDTIHPGIYFVRLSQGGRSKVVKVVVMF
jgi:hypothetical protein